MEDPDSTLTSAPCPPALMPRATETPPAVAEASPVRSSMLPEDARFSVLVRDVEREIEPVSLREAEVEREMVEGRWWR